MFEIFMEREAPTRRYCLRGAISGCTNALGEGRILLEY